MEWNDFYSKMADLVASKSKDRSTQVGAIAVGPDKEVRATGYNGFPRGANDQRDDWHERPKKYGVTIHAENNMIANAARVGVSLKGCTTYVSLPPCSTCTGMLVQAGIKEIIVLDAPKEWDGYDRWKEEFSLSQEILDEVGIPIKFLKR